MKKPVILGVVMLLLMMAMPMAMPVVASADETNPEEYTYNIIKSAHKIKNKWDLSGSFVAHPGYNWGGLAEGATWSYSIHIKEAMDGQFSVGSIHFMTDDIDVVGHVKETKADYPYWGSPNLAAVGTAEYNDTTYYFMFLFSERAMWFALSGDPYDTYWAIGTVWGSSARDYQLHSKVPDESFTIDYKAIHE